MKKKMILLLWLTSISLVAFSQDFRKLGIGVGYGTSSIVGDSIHPLELSLRYRLDRKHTFQLYVPLYQNKTTYDYGYSKTVRDRLVGVGIGYDYSFLTYSNLDFIAGINTDYSWFENRENYHAIYDEYEDGVFKGKIEDRSLMWKKHKGVNLLPNTGVRFTLNNLSAELKLNLRISHIARKRYFHGIKWNHTLLPDSPISGWEEPSVYTIYSDKLQGFLSFNLCYYF